MVTLEKEGLHFKLHLNADGTFSLTTHNGGAGVADQGLEIEGIRWQLHDNGDGTFSPCVTTSTGASDIQIESQGFRLKMHPTGQNDPVTKEPMYAMVTFGV